MILGLILYNNILSCTCTRIFRYNDLVKWVVAISYHMFFTIIYTFIPDPISQSHLQFCRTHVQAFFASLCQFSMDPTDHPPLTSLTPFSPPSNQDRNTCQPKSPLRLSNRQMTAYLCLFFFSPDPISPIFILAQKQKICCHFTFLSAPHTH